MSESQGDTGDLVSELADDADMVELVEMFVGELSEKVANMAKSLEDQDFDTLSRLAHQLKGSGGGYGFPAITEAAKALERNAKGVQDIEALAAQVEALASLCDRARATPPNA
jgi:HPt (histidine-containing phosphotransfer) domain-containing protein